MSNKVLYIFLIHIFFVNTCMILGVLQSIHIHILLPLTHIFISWNINKIDSSTYVALRRIL